MILEILLLAVTSLVLWILYSRRLPKGFPKGPRGVPLFGYLPWLLPDVHVNLGKLVEKYGSVFSVKLGSEIYVVINDFDLIKESMKMEVFSGRPKHLLAMEPFKNGITYNDGSIWAEQRRFSVKTLRDFGFGKQSMEAMILDSAQDWINYNRERLGQPMQINHVFPMVALNALWTMIAGEKLALGGEDNKAMKIFTIGKKGVTEQAMAGPLYVMPWLAKLLPEATGYKLLLDARNEISSMARDLVIEHKSTISPGSPRDYIDMYLEKMKEADSDPKSSFYRETGVANLIDTLLTFMLAGGDTLTSTMDFTILFLLKNPHVTVKIQEEIDRVVGRSRLPSTTDRPLMPYTEAVMCESFRLSAIVPGAILHSTTQDVEFHGYFLPKGTIIYPNLYQVHHDEKYWGDPKKFRPERFLNPNGTFRKDERVLPFSIGKRECPAANIGYFEYFLFLTTLLQEFDIKADPNVPLPPNDVKTSFVLDTEPYNVIFSERK